MSCAPLLYITDGDVEINLLSDITGFLLVDWQQSLAQPKSGGTWQSSPFEDGRSLVMRTKDNIIDVMTLSVRDLTQNATIRHLRKLYQLLEKATQYWTTTWSHEPVWIVARAAGETNARYAIIKDYRIPKDVNSYNQPFFSNAPAGTDIQLTLEHGLWTNEEPGSASCVEISEGGNLTSSLNFGDYGNRNVNGGSAASIDNLPGTTFTAEAWIKANALGYGSNYGRALWKGGWYLAMTDLSGLNNIQGFVDCLTQNADVYAQLEFGEWYHVAITFVHATKVLNLWVNGLLADTDTGVGNFQGDGAQTFYVGSQTADVNVFEGSIGWVRISDVVRYTTQFTPSPLCTPPEIDSNTKLQYHFVEGIGTTITDYSTYGNTGTLSAAAIWNEQICTGPRYDTCENEIFIQNTNIDVKLTDIYINDNSAGTWSGNLAPNTDYDLLPDPFSAGDAIYFGIRSTLPGVPPKNLVFDIGQNIAAGTLLWEFYDGVAWQTIPSWGLVDNTNDGSRPMGNLGVNVVSWDVYATSSLYGPGADWLNANLFTLFGGTAPNVNAWWIRLRCSVGTNITPVPAQQNRPVYYACWNNIDIAEDVVTGDIPAIGRILSTSAIHFDINAAGTEIFRQGRLIAGLRSLSRGEDFASIIPVSDRCSSKAVTFTISGAWQNSVYSSTRRQAIYTPAAKPSTGNVALQMHFQQHAVRDFFGTYRIFLRGIAPLADWEEYEYYWSVRMEDVSGDFYADYDSTKRTLFAPYDAWSLGRFMDLGIITLPPPNTIFNYADESDTLQQMSILIKVDVDNPAALNSTSFHDIILIPIDEWAIDTISNSMYTGDNRSVLDIDSVTIPKETIRAVERNYDLTLAGAFYSVSSTGKAILQSNAKQRLHFYIHDIKPAGMTYYSAHDPNYVTQLRLQALMRYQSMRGDT